MNENVFTKGRNGVPWSVKSSGRELRSCLGQAFNSKLGRTGILRGNCVSYMQSLLKLKTWFRLAKVCPWQYLFMLLTAMSV
jgi:hypothetical protein